MTTDLRTLVSLLPDADEPVYFSPDVARELESACDRFEAEWKRLFGAIPKPVAPSDDDVDADSSRPVNQGDDE